AWIDPEVVELAGISADELERYRNPDAFEASDTPVPQPAFDPDRPWPRGIPQEMYVGLINTPDDVVTATMSENTPPVLVED
ncbi:MAG: VOC family protein, partial [Ilumatobacter sp.]